LLHRSHQHRERGLAFSAPERSPIARALSVPRDYM
jgi:hypothetical protein